MIKKSPRGKLYSSQCYKRGYNNKKECKIAIKKARNTKRKLKSAYECSYCGKWHMSHLAVKEYKRKVADYLLIKFLENDLNE